MTTIRTYYKEEWNLIALFCATIDLDTIIAAAMAIDVDPTIPHENVAVIDETDGSILWNAKSAAEYDEPADIDSDMGFDPYMGCFSDDC